MFAMPLIGASPQVGGGLAGGAGASGGLMAAAAPWMLGGTIALGGLSALADMQSKKRAKRSFRNAQQAQLNAVDLDTSADRQAVQEQYGDMKSQAKSRLAERGVTGSTAMDSVLNTYGTGQQRAMSTIGNERDRRRAAILGQLGPQDNGTAGALGGLAGLAGSAASLGFAQDRARQQDDLYRQLLAGGGSVGGDNLVVRNQLAGNEALARMGGQNALWDLYYKGRR